MVFHNSLFLPEGNPNLINVRSFLNIQSCSVLFEYNQRKPSLYNDLMRKAPSCPVLRWRKTTQSDLNINLTVCLENSRILSLPAPTWTLPSWPAEPRVMPSWSQPHAVTPQIKEDAPDGFCKRWNLMNPWRIMLRKDTSCFRGELLHSFLPDSSEGLSFPWLIAPVPFGEGEFVSLTVPQWQRPILDVTGAWCSRVGNKEARSEHVFSQGSASFVAGGWGRSAASQTFSWL